MLALEAQSKATIAGLPEFPAPLTVNVEEMVPHKVAVFPAEALKPLPIARALAQLDPLADPAAFWA
jgi:hypothetical protein